MCKEGILLHNRAILRNKTSLLIVIGAVLFVWVPPYRRFLTGAPYGSLLAYVYDGSICSVFYLFILFLFLGFYAARFVIDSELTELLPGYALRAYVKNSIVWCAVCAAPIIGLLVLPSVVSYCMDGRSFLRFFAMIMKDLLLYAISSATIGFLVGFLFGMIRNLYLSLAGVLVSAFVASPIMWNLSTSGFWLFGWSAFLTSFVPRGNQWMIEYNYWRFGWCRACVTILWIGVLLLVLLIVLRGTIVRKMIASLLIVLSAVLLVVSERTLTGLEWSRGTLANYYYRLYEDSRKGYYRSDVENSVCDNFCVSSYEMDIRCFPAFSAKVSMSIADRKNDEALVFTLYHGYSVSSVEDGDGKRLSFERNGDWLIVSLPTDQSKITVKYSGKNGPCYVGADGVYLRPGFPYYPFAGKQSPATSTGGFQTCRHIAADFSVTFHTLQKVYSNLSGKDGVFNGKSDAPMFVSGYLDEKNVDGTRIIAPESCFADMTEDEESRWIQLVAQSLKKRENKPKCVIFGNAGAEIRTMGYLKFTDYEFVPSWYSLKNLEKYGLWDEKRLPFTLEDIEQSDEKEETNAD